MRWQSSLDTSEATQQLGRLLGARLPAGSVLLLAGDLGAGKTTLVQGIGAGLGIAEAIVSPTFALIGEYLDGRVPLYHLDLYRLEPPAVAGLCLELYWEGVEVPPGIVAVEWSQRLPYLPPSYWRIELTAASDGDRRQVTIASAGPEAIDLTALLAEFAPDGTA